MTLSDKLKAHALVVTRSAHFGEAATLHLKAGGSRSVQVVVDREGLVRSEEGNLVHEQVAVFIPNDATLGITSFVDGDELELSFSAGDPPKRGRLMVLLSEDAGGFFVEVQA